MDRALITTLALALGCGGAAPPPPEPAPAATAIVEAPSPPVARTVVLSAALPEATRTNSGLAPDGTLYCRQTYFATPPSDEHGCVADGYGVTAPVLHAIDPSGAARVYLDGPLDLVRIADCGNDERPVRRPRAPLLARITPELSAAPRAETVDLRAVQFASCPHADLALQVPHDATLIARGAVLRIESLQPREVELVIAGEQRHRWHVEDGALELEALCNERFVVIASGIVGADEEARASTREATLACVPASSARAWRSFERLRIDREQGTIVPIEITAPTFSLNIR